MKNRIICIVGAILLFTAGCGEKHVGETGEENIQDMVRQSINSISREEILQFQEDGGEGILYVEEDAEEEPVPEDEEDKVIYHEAGECKRITFGSVQIDLEFYDVVKEERSKNSATFWGEEDQLSGILTPKIVVEIQRSSIDVNSYEDAKQFFDGCISYSAIEMYSGMEELTGMTKLYAAYEGEINYCLAVYPEEMYLIRSEGLRIQRDMLYRKNRDFLEKTYEIKEIECAQGKTIKVTEEISYPDKEAFYELYVEGKETPDYFLQHKIEGEPWDYQNTVTVYDSEGLCLQTFNWESWQAEDYLTFLDVNLDGYADLQTVTAKGTSYDVHELYTWKETEQKFEKVECDGVLADMEVRGDRIWNWVRSIPGYVVEVYRWDGNRLIMESQEYIEPDQ